MIYSNKKLNGKHRQQTQASQYIFKMPEPICIILPDLNAVMSWIHLLTL